MKNFFKNISKRKLFLGVIIIFIMIMVVVGIKGTYAFYQDSQNIAILSSKVGDFSGEGESVKKGPVDGDTDINVILYTQMPDNPDKYKESKYVPALGYNVNPEKSNCYPESGEEIGYTNGEIKEDGTVHFAIRDDKPTQITCRIYYDRDMLSDIVIYAMVKDANGDKTYKGNKYKLVNTILDTYTYDGYTCSKDDTFTNIHYDETTKKFSFNATGPNTCYAYFSPS